MYYNNLKGVFVENGTETHFEIGQNVAFIKSESSGKRVHGLVHKLFVNGELIQAMNWWYFKNMESNNTYFNSVKMCKDWLIN